MQDASIKLIFSNEIKEEKCYHVVATQASLSSQDNLACLAPGAPLHAGAPQARLADRRRLRGRNLHRPHRQRLLSRLDAGTASRGDLPLAG